MAFCKDLTVIKYNCSKWYSYSKKQYFLNGLEGEYQVLYGTLIGDLMVVIISTYVVGVSFLG